MAHSEYVSGLPSGFKVREVAKSLCTEVGGNCVIDAVVHTDNAFFLICKDAQSCESIVQQFHGTTVYQGLGQVSRLTPELNNVLLQLKPDLFGAMSKPAPTTNMVGKSATQSKVNLQLSDVLEAISSWTSEQKQQLGTALGFNQMGVNVPASRTGHGGPTFSPAPGPAVATSQPAPSFTAHYQHQAPQQQVYRTPQLPQPCFTSTPQQGQSFQFGSSNTINNIRVSTFSGSSKECSYEQFRHDVQSLLKQGCPEIMVLNAIKRSIKGQAQEIVLHMGEDATVRDI